MLDIILIIVCIILCVWVIVLYGLNFHNQGVEEKSTEFSNQYENIVNTCLMIFSLSRQIVLKEEDFSYKELGRHKLLVEIIRDKDWVRFVFNFRTRKIVITDLTEVQEGRRSQITLRIKDNGIEENSLMAFFGIPHPHKEEKLREIVEVASAKQKEILAKASPNEILNEIVLPFLLRKVNIDEKEDTTVLITFLAAIMDEEEKTKEDE